MICIAVVFQFSGGVNLAVVSQMSGALALKMEDIMMAGYVSQHGTLVCYNVPFEISFYFPGGVVNLCDDLCGMQLDLCEYGECGRFGVSKFRGGFLSYVGNFRV